jgi:hypothetical protein
MIESTDPKIIHETAVRCSECDREMLHYNTFLSPENEEHVVCWECTARAEKGFNTKRTFYREARHGDIPR